MDDGFYRVVSQPSNTTADWLKEVGVTGNEWQDRIRILKLECLAHQLSFRNNLSTETDPFLQLDWNNAFQMLLRSLANELVDLCVMSQEDPPCISNVSTWPHKMIDILEALLMRCDAVVAQYVNVDAGADRSHAHLSAYEVVLNLLVDALDRGVLKNMNSFDADDTTLSPHTRWVTLCSLCIPVARLRATLAMMVPRVCNHMVCWPSHDVGLQQTYVFLERCASLNAMGTTIVTDYWSPFADVFGIGDSILSLDNVMSEDLFVNIFTTVIRTRLHCIDSQHGGRKGCLGCCGNIFGCDQSECVLIQSICTCSMVPPGMDSLLVWLSDCICRSRQIQSYNLTHLQTLCTLFNLSDSICTASIPMLTVQTDKISPILLNFIVRLCDFVVAEHPGNGPELSLLHDSFLDIVCASLELGCDRVRESSDVRNMNSASVAAFATTDPDMSNDITSVWCLLLLRPSLRAHLARRWLQRPDGPDMDDRNGHIAVQCTELLSFWLCPREFMRVCRGIDNSNVGHKSLSEDYTVCEIRTRLQTNMHPMAVMQDLRSLFHVSIQLYNRSLTLAMDYICTAFSTNGGDGRVLIRVEPSDPLAWIGRYRTLMLESHHASGFRDVIFDSCRIPVPLDRWLLSCLLTVTISDRSDNHSVERCSDLLIAWLRNMVQWRFVIYRHIVILETIVLIFPISFEFLTGCDSITTSKRHSHLISNLTNINECGAIELLAEACCELLASLAAIHHELNKSQHRSDQTRLDSALRQELQTLRIQCADCFVPVLQRMSCEIKSGRRRHIVYVLENCITLPELNNEATGV